MTAPGVTMLRLVPLLLMTVACGGEPDPAPTPDRTPCEQICWDRDLLPCRDRCDADCGADDRCRDQCHGDCLSGYQDCVADTCD